MLQVMESPRTCWPRKDMVLQVTGGESVKRDFELCTFAVLLPQ